MAACAAILAAEKAGKEIRGYERSAVARTKREIDRVASGPVDYVKRKSEKRAAKRRIEDYGEDCANPEERKACERDLEGFALRYFPRRFTLAFSDDHRRMIDLLQSTILDGGQFAVAMPRGSGKTTVMETACIWAALYGHRRFVFVVGADATAAAQITESIRQELEDNELLSEDFRHACKPIAALEGIARRAEGQAYSDGTPTKLEWTKEGIRLPCRSMRGGSVMRATGITGRIRGAKASLADGSQVRPDLVLVDDPQTDESARSASQVQRRMGTINGTILGLGGPGQRIAALCAATVIQRGDVADQLLDRKKSPGWQGFTGRLMVSMPTKKNLWDEYAEILSDDLRLERGRDRATKFYAANREAMDAGAKAAWAQRYEPGELSAIQHAMNLLIRNQEAFYAEYQNQPLGLEASDALVQLEPEAVAKRLNRKKPGVVPVGAQELVAFIDVGEGVLWYQVAAFQQGFRGDCVAYGAWPEPGRAYFTKAESKDLLRSRYPLGSIQATWTAALTELCEMLMARDWQGEDGESHRISLALIDAGDGDATDTIFEFIAQSPFRDRLHPSRGKGIGATNRPMGDWPKNKGDTLGNGWRIQRNKVRRQKEVVIDVNRWKSFVADRLTAPAGGPSCYYLHGDHSGAHELMSHHLCSERRIRVTAVGRSVDEWRIKPGQDNDLLDTTVGVHVAASIRGIRLSDLPSQENRGAGPVSFAEQQRAARERRRA